MFCPISLEGISFYTIVTGFKLLVNMLLDVLLEKVSLFPNTMMMDGPTIGQQSSSGTGQISGGQGSGSGSGGGDDGDKGRGNRKIPLERIAFTDAFADADQIAVRDNVIANGYDPNVTNQPYARGLADRLRVIARRDMHLQLSETLPVGDINYIQAMMRHYNPNFNVNINNYNTENFRTFLKRLP